MLHNVVVTLDVFPEPTVATVKRLYAHALRCARPDCTRPLYNQDNDTGEWILNSRIAHIHARRRGGPRWMEMTAEQNRADTNLLLLCIEHSYDVDERPDAFPPDLLRDWKQAQLDEYVAVARGWPLTDVDAGRVLQASSVSLEREHAGAVVAVARAAERFTLAARQAREGPAAAAAAWRSVYEQARRSFQGWDEDGNAVHAEPSRFENDRGRAVLSAALRAAAELLAPLANDVKVELAAARASRPTTNRWTDWVARAVDAVLAASSTWPAPPQLNDDDRLETSLREVSKAVDALSAAWRGDRTEQPPAAPHTPPADTVAEDPVSAHRALLDRARPFHRVDHRPYDQDLRAQLGSAAEQAATLPPVASALGIGLSTTCALAAAVAGNAPEDVLIALADQDAARRPLSAAVHLLGETVRYAHRRGFTERATWAQGRLLDLWESVDLTCVSTYDADDANGRHVFAYGALVTTPDRVRQRLEQALTSTPEILLPFIGYCASWYENIDFATHRTRAIHRRYSDLPAWFPTSSIVATAAAAAVLPAAPTGVADPDGAESLLAQLLQLAAE